MTGCQDFVDSDLVTSLRDVLSIRHHCSAHSPVSLNIMHLCANYMRLCKPHALGPRMFDVCTCTRKSLGSEIITTLNTWTWSVGSCSIFRGGLFVGHTAYGMCHWGSSLELVYPFCGVWTWPARVPGAAARDRNWAAAVSRPVSGLPQMHGHAGLGLNTNTPQSARCKSLGYPGGASSGLGSRPAFAVGRPLHVHAARGCTFTLLIAERRICTLVHVLAGLTFPARTHGAL